MNILCSCGVECTSVSAWRAHYDALRPASALARRAFTGQHVPDTAPSASPSGAGGATTPVDPQAGLKAAIADAQLEMDQARIRLQMAIERHHALCTELEPPAPTEPVYHYYKAPIKLPCFKCGVSTPWRLRGLPRCKNDAHRESIPHVARDTRGVSAKVWAILLDEEVE